MYYDPSWGTTLTKARRYEDMLKRQRLLEEQLLVRDAQIERLRDRIVEYELEKRRDSEEEESTLV